MNNSEINKLIAEYEKRAVPDDEIDYSGLPPLTDKQLSEFKPVHPEISRASAKYEDLLPKDSEYFKPVREQVSIRMSKILVDHFRSMGKGWQTKVNDFLMVAYANGQI